MKNVFCLPNAAQHGDLYMPSKSYYVIGLEDDDDSGLSGLQLCVRDYGMDGGCAEVNWWRRHFLDVVP